MNAILSPARYRSLKPQRSPRDAFSFCSLPHSRAFLGALCVLCERHKLFSRLLVALTQAAKVSRHQDRQEMHFLLVSPILEPSLAPFAFFARGCFCCLSSPITVSRFCVVLCVRHWSLSHQLPNVAGKLPRYTSTKLAVSCSHLCPSRAFFVEGTAFSVRRSLFRAPSSSRSALRVPSSEFPVRMFHLCFG